MKVNPQRSNKAHTIQPQHPVLVLAGCCPIDHTLTVTQHTDTDTPGDLGTPYCIHTVEYSIQYVYERESSAGSLTHNSGCPRTSVRCRTLIATHGSVVLYGFIVYSLRRVPRSILQREFVVNQRSVNPRQKYEVTRVCFNYVVSTTLECKKA